MLTLPHNFEASIVVVFAILCLSLHRMEGTGTKSLFKIVNGLRHFGVGAKVTRSIYKFPETYWILTKVRLTPDQKHGTVYGRMVWRGRPKPVEEKITSSLKKEWKLLALPDYKTFNATPEELAQMIPTNTERTC